jgi:hypothetical protein
MYKAKNNEEFKNILSCLDTLMHDFELMCKSLYILKEDVESYIVLAHPRGEEETDQLPCSQHDKFEIERMAMSAMVRTRKIMVG